MSAVSVTWRRTLGRTRYLYSTSLAVGGFLAAAGATFAFGLESAEGGRLLLAAVWAASVAPWLPVLAAFLAMDVWSDERLTGRVDLLLTAAVRERDFVYGKFLGVWTMVMAAIIFFFATSVACLWIFAPSAIAGVAPSSFLPAFLVLALQSALWCAASVALSAMFSHAAAAAFSAVVLTAALPRGLWAGLMAWSRDGRTAFGEMPLDAHVVDFASGVVSVGTAVAYLVVSVLLLYVAVKCVLSLRLVGRGAFALRVSTGFSLLLAIVVAALAVRLAMRLDVTIDMSESGSSGVFSSRTTSILAESSGDVSVTCFLPRSDTRFRMAAHFLRSLKRASAAVGGVRFEIRFVAPRWDVGAAERLVRRGVATESLVFEKGRRMVALPLADGVSERVCASTIRRLSSPPPRRNICWTVGHGEYSFDAYDTFGMSDVARHLAREGYSNAAIDLSTVRQVPGDCALILIAGAKDDFSRAELEVLDSYLRGGGRLLVLMNTVRAGGLVSLLSAWGLRPQEQDVVGAKTLSGTDVVVSGFADHAVSAALKGLRIVLERPVSFVPSAAAKAGTGADRIEYAPLASVGSITPAAAVERGSGAGSDLAIRPTRLVVVGDAGFVLNGQLASRANANLDFFLNCIAYLAGRDATDAGGNEAGLLITDMDRSVRVRHVVVTSVALPALVFVILAGMAFRRRHRS